ncbi:MAG: hypothetical protein AB1507_04235 [Bacillota bacterium]
MDKRKRRQNEKKFGSWEELPGGGRLYWFEVIGRSGWKARYLKKVDSEEETLKFYQEIYNDKGELVEIHEKYPVNKGHKRIK